MNVQKILTLIEQICRDRIGTGATMVSLDVDCFTAVNHEEVEEVAERLTADFPTWTVAVDYTLKFGNTSRIGITMQK